MASYHDSQLSSTSPLVDDSSPRAACMAGAPPLGALTPSEATPDNQLLPSQRLAPDASRTLLPLEVERALRLVDELAALGVGSMQVAFHDLPRAAFDAIPDPLEAYWLAATDESSECWTKALRSAGGTRIVFFTNEPPAEAAA